MKINWRSNAIRSLAHVLAPMMILFITAAIIYGSSALTLPEKLLPYETLFLIFSTMFSLFFIAITVPCAVFGGYLAVKAIIRDKKYILPVITLALNVGVLFVWVYAIRYFF